MRWEIEVNYQTDINMFSNCGAGEASWESLGLQANQTSQSQKKTTLNIHWKDCCWNWSSNTLATWWCKELTHWKKPWRWERLRAGEEGDIRGWDCIIDSMDLSLSKLRDIVNDREAWRVAVHGVTKSQTGLTNWTATNILGSVKFKIKVWSKYQSYKS